MDEFLDNLPEREKSDTFTRLSIFSSVTSMVCFFILMDQIYGPIDAGQGFIEPNILLIRATQIFMIASVLFLVASYVKKERKGWKRWLATILSSIIFFSIIGSIIFMYYIDNFAK